MAERPLTDPRVLDAIPVNYALLLQQPARGHALWDPMPVADGGGCIGDCGYISGGRFIKLFNVFDDGNPLGIALTTHPGDVTAASKQNLNDILASSQCHSINVSANLQSGPLTIPPAIEVKLSAGAHASFDERKVAFLGFCGPERKTSRYDKVRLLETYLAMHCDRIVEHYGAEYPIEVENIAIVHGTTTSSSWLGGISSSRCSSFGVTGSVGAAEGTVDLSSTQFGPWTFTYGDRSWDVRQPEDHCVVVRLVKCKRRVRKRVKVALKVLGSSVASVFGLPNQQVKKAPSVTDQPTTSSSPESPGTTNANSPGISTCSCESDGSSDGSDEESLIVHGESDMLDHLLDVILQSDSNIDCAVGNWDVLARYFESCGPIDLSHSDGSELDFSLTPRFIYQKIKDSTIAHLVSVCREAYADGDDGTSSTAVSSIVTFSHEYDHTQRQYGVVQQQQQKLSPFYQHPWGSHQAQQSWSGKLELAEDGSLHSPSSPGLPPYGWESKNFAFLALPGNAIRKRPRRRHDEIERLYPCSWPNCNRSYGTLNHLNAHITMQRHGEKRSPNEFKEMRKRYRKQKKEEATAMQKQSLNDSEPEGANSRTLAGRSRPMSWPESLTTCMPPAELDTSPGPVSTTRSPARSPTPPSSRFIHSALPPEDLAVEPDQMSPWRSMHAHGPLINCYIPNH